MLSCTANGQSVRLGEKEYRILEYLIANGGQIQWPNKNTHNEGMEQNITQERQPSSSASWAIIGVSILVLAFGLVFAFTYKRRK